PSSSNAIDPCRPHRAPPGLILQPQSGTANPGVPLRSRWRLPQTAWTALGLAGLVSLCSVAYAQQNTNFIRCATMAVHQTLLQTYPPFSNNLANLEIFTSAFSADAKARGAAGLRAGIVTIPVVVHVVYRTTAENISDAQIQSQIAVLNADYRALNTDIGLVP